MDNLSLQKQINFSTVFLTVYKENKIDSFGVCFNIIVNNDKEDHYFLVTCAHLIEEATRTDLYFYKPDKNNEPDINDVKKVVMNNPKNHWIIHKDRENIDLAIASIEKIRDTIDEEEANDILCPSIPEDFIATLKMEKDFEPVEDVLTIGYPIVSQYKGILIPISRTGITATPFYYDIDDLPYFLIDVETFPGNSGSPVFILKGESFGQGLIIGCELLLAGMTCRTEYFKEKAELTSSIENIDKKIDEVEIKHFSGLGRVLKSRVIIDFIMSHLEK